MLEKWITFFKAHERLIIVLVVLTFGYHAYGDYLAWSAARKDAAVAALTSIVDKDKAAEANLAITASTAASEYQKALTANQAQIASLAKALQQSQAVLVKNRQTDDGLELPALAARLVQLAPAVSIADVSTANNTLTLQPPAGHAVVDQLETIPSLQDDLKAQETLVTEQQLTLADASKAVAACTTDAAALKATVADQDKKFIDEVSAAKVREKKAWRSGFKWGVVTGFIGGLFVGHAAI